MSESQTPATTKIAFKRAEPQLFATDLSRSLSYFTDKLGFDIAFTYGEPPFYAQVSRGEAHLNLRHVDHPLVDPSARQQEDYLAATICIEGIKDLYLEYQANNVEFGQTLRTEPWGARTYVIKDPDNNLILFAE